MNIQNAQITDNDLMAYADGQLDDARRLEVEQFVVNSPVAAEKLVEFQRQSGAISGLFQPVLDEDIPARLMPGKIAHTAQAQRNNMMRYAAAAIILLGFGVGVGWFGRDLINTAPGPTATLIAEAVDAHELYVVQKAHPVEVRSDQTPHLTTWLSKSLDRRLVMPDLTSAGYNLVGGRLLPGATGSAAQIMYEDANGQRITLYFTPRRVDEPLGNQYEEIDGLMALYWANDTLTCTIIGKLDRPALDIIAKKVFSTLSPDDYRQS